MVTVTISAKSVKVTIDVPIDGTIGDIKQAVEKTTNLQVCRQRITANGDKKALENEIQLSSVLGASLKDGELFLKDLGPQIGWRTVFLIEYLGPLLIHPIFFHFSEFMYGREVEHSNMQNVAYAFVMLHFIKRQFETLFVHRFSHGTMPIMNLFKNSAHYHLMSGILLAYDLYRPLHSATSESIKGTIRDSNTFITLCTAIWALAQLSNFHTHMTLRSLRPHGTKKRAVPHGYGFNYLSCPNYFFEIISWVMLTIMTGSLSAFAFTLLGATQMAIWAAKKHRNYKKEFGKTYPKDRYVLIPFVF